MASITAIRGPVVTYTNKPITDSEQLKIGYEPDAIILLSNGQITDVGPAKEIQDKLPSDSTIEESRICRFIKILIGQ